MNINLLILTISGFIAFIIPSLIYKISFANKNPFAAKKEKLTSIFLPFAVSSLIVCSILYPIIFDRHEFLYPFNFIEMISPLIAAIILFLCSKNSHISRFFPLFLFLTCVACSYSIPTETISAIFPFPALYTRLIITAAWFLFSYIYRYANSGGATLGIQSAGIAIGITALSLIEAIPFFIGLIAAIISAGCLSIITATWPPANKTISNNSSTCLGFIIFALMVWTSGEQAISCVGILALYFIIDFIWAFALRLTFIDQYSNIKENTAYRQALAKGISPQTASAFLCKAQLLIILFGVFQAISPQQNSLLLVSTLVAIWLSYKMRNLDENNKTIKDLNKEVIEDIQSRINNIKQYINKEENDQ